MNMAPCDVSLCERLANQCYSFLVVAHRDRSLLEGLTGQLLQIPSENIEEKS